MAAYLLIVTDDKGAAARANADQVFEKLLLLFLTEGFWPHLVSASGEGVLQSGDRVLFGLLRQRDLRVVGEALVAEDSAPLAPGEAANVRVYLGPLLDTERPTHGVRLEGLRMWDRAWEPAGESGAAAAELLEAAVGVTQTGAVRPVGSAALEVVAGRPSDEGDGPAPAAPAPLAAAAETPPLAKADVWDLIQSNWSLVDFGEPLCLLNGNGPKDARETPAGPVDALCESETNGDLVAVMWADGAEATALAPSLREQLGWLREAVARPEQAVRGMILTLRPDVVGLVEPHIEVRRVKIVCEPSGMPSATRPESPFPASNLAPPPVVTPPAPVRAPAHEGATATDQPAPPSPALDFAARCLRVPLTRGLAGAGRPS